MKGRMLEYDLLQSNSERANDAGTLYNQRFGVTEHSSLYLSPSLNPTLHNVDRYVHLTTSLSLRSILRATGRSVEGDSRFV